MSEWHKIRTAPKGTNLLFWWRPRTDSRYPHPPEFASELSNNRYAESCVIGQISSHEEGKWWDGQRGVYQDIWHITHWKRLPRSPIPNGEKDRGCNPH